MENNQDVQEVLNTLSNSISANESFATSNESFAASIAKAASAVVAMESTHYAEQQQKDHEQLQRIAAQHQHEVQQEQQQQEQQLKDEQQQHQQQQDQQDQQQQQQPQVLPPQEQDPTTAVLQAAALQDEQHQQVLQHIATAAAEAGSTLATVPITASSPQPPAKAAVGSAEWHKIRRDNHKEVERRRRETINEGINGLAKMVPNCDKNKGSILKEAVKYIKSVLVENERLTAEIAVATTAKYEIEKYLMEKSVAEATTHSLNVQYEQLKREYEELRQKMDEAEGGPSTKKQRTE